MRLVFQVIYYYFYILAMYQSLENIRSASTRLIPSSLAAIPINSNSMQNNINPSIFHQFNGIAQVPLFNTVSQVSLQNGQFLQPILDAPLNYPAALSLPHQSNLSQVVKKWKKEIKTRLIDQAFINEVNKSKKSSSCSGGESYRDDYNKKRKLNESYVVSEKSSNLGKGDKNNKPKHICPICNILSYHREDACEKYECSICNKQHAKKRSCATASNYNN